MITPALETTRAIGGSGRNQRGSGWLRIRSGLAFALACVLSPCCAPLIVMVIMAGLAGTPLAVWVGAHLGWLYGALTLASVLSLALGVRWARNRPARGANQELP